MKSFFSFIFAGAFAQTLDCSHYILWVPGIFPGEGYLVKHEGKLYKSWYYAMPEFVPGEHETWLSQGECTTGGFTDVQVDCSSSPLWSATKIYSEPTNVSHEDRAWRNAYYSSGSSEEPGVGGSWIPLGVCEGSSEVIPPVTVAPTTPVSSAHTQVATTPIPTTHGAVTAAPTTIPPTTPTVTQRATQLTTTTSKVVTGSGVDCSETHKWSGTMAYSVQGDYVHYRESMYVVKHWTQGVKPDSLQGWELVGPCIEGTAVLGIPDDAGLGAIGEERLCTCCTGCATASGTTPECLDTVTDEWDCLYTWCPAYNSYDPERCEEVKDKGMLEWYGGELVEGHTVWPSRVFIPYIDVSLGKIPLLEDVHDATGVKHFVLAFVTAMGGSKCEGGFGGSQSVGKGAVWWGTTGEINIYSQVNAIRKLGGDAIVSMGGASGTELADSSACQGTDAIAKLKAAYESVLDITKQTVLDFDIEGPAISSGNRATGWANRFEAVNQITAERPSLRVWWTLPTWPTGLTADGLAFINDMMVSGARFDVINLMTMDYGAEMDAVCRGDDGEPDMHTCEQMAVDSVATQLFDTAKSLGLLTKYGWTSYKDAHAFVGSTSMIGVNDVSTEVYTLGDASRSMKVWKEEKTNVKVISMWSVARDSPCAQNSASPTCSGGSVQTEDYEFARLFQNIYTQ